MEPLLLCDSYDPGKAAFRSNKRGCGQSCDLIELALAWCGLVYVG